MENRKLLKFDEGGFVLKEVIVEANGDTVWDIKEKETQNSFVIHTSHEGHVYITFFKNMPISKEVGRNALKKVCEILLERGLHPTINIYYQNLPLICLCTSVGFRKLKKVKHLYYLKKVKA